NSLTADVADGQTHSAVIEQEGVIIVAANTLLRAATSGEADTVDGREFLGKEALLHFASDLDLAMNALPMRCFIGKRARQVADLKRQSGLGRDRLEQPQIGRRVRFFRALRA